MKLQDLATVLNGNPWLPSTFGIVPCRIRENLMTRFYKSDLNQDINSPFIRDGADKLVRRSYWLDMDDRTLVMVMVNGIGANLTNDEKRAHLADLRREHLVD